MDIGKLALRTVVGGLLVGHGLQKLRGSFGGPGIEGAAGMMHSLGMVPGKRNAYAASLSEAVGGGLLVLGAATPVAAAAIVATMATAVRKVHLKNGPWVTNGGFEYNLVLMAAVASIVMDGPGVVSLDALVGKARWGAAMGVVSVAAGVGASFAAVEVGRREAAKLPAPASPSEGAEA